MAKEIERKFLLLNDGWRKDAAPPRHLVQGYFDTGVNGCTLRVRSDDGRGRLTIKGRPSGFARSEFEYEIPAADVAEMLREFCAPRVVDKLRYVVEFGGFEWEIDEYLGLNAGLFTAEIELTSEDVDFPRPPWLGEEVSGVARYTNGALSRCPYTTWVK